MPKESLSSKLAKQGVFVPTEADFAAFRREYRANNPAITNDNYVRYVYVKEKLPSYYEDVYKDTLPHEFSLHDPMVDDDGNVDKEMEERHEEYQHLRAGSGEDILDTFTSYVYDKYLADDKELSIDKISAEEAKAFREKIAQADRFSVRSGSSETARKALIRNAQKEMLKVEIGGLPLPTDKRAIVETIMHRDFVYTIDEDTETDELLVKNWSEVEGKYRIAKAGLDAFHEIKGTLNLSEEEQVDYEKTLCKAELKLEYLKCRMELLTDPRSAFVDEKMAFENIPYSFTKEAALAEGYSAEDAEYIDKLRAMKEAHGKMILAVMLDSLPGKISFNEIEESTVFYGVNGEMSKDELYDALSKRGEPIIAQSLRDKEGKAVDPSMIRQHLLMLDVDGKLKITNGPADFKNIVDGLKPSLWTRFLNLFVAQPECARYEKALQSLQKFSRMGEAMLEHNRNVPQAIEKAKEEAAAAQELEKENVAQAQDKPEQVKEEVVAPEVNVQEPKVSASEIAEHSALYDGILKRLSGDFSTIMEDVEVVDEDDELEYVSKMMACIDCKKMLEADPPQLKNAKEVADLGQKYFDEGKFKDAVAEMLKFGGVNYGFVCVLASEKPEDIYEVLAGKASKFRKEYERLKDQPKEAAEEQPAEEKSAEQKSTEQKSDEKKLTAEEEFKKLIQDVTQKAQLLKVKQGLIKEHQAAQSDKEAEKAAMKEAEEIVHLKHHVESLKGVEKQKAEKELAFKESQAKSRVTSPTLTGFDAYFDVLDIKEKIAPLISNELVERMATNDSAPLNKESGDIKNMTSEQRDALQKELNSKLLGDTKDELPLSDMLDTLVKSDKLVDMLKANNPVGAMTDAFLGQVNALQNGQPAEETVSVAQDVNEKSNEMTMNIPG